MRQSLHAARLRLANALIRIGVLANMSAEPGVRNRKRNAVWLTPNFELYIGEPVRDSDPIDDLSDGIGSELDNRPRRDSA